MRHVNSDSSLDSSVSDEVLRVAVHAGQSVPDDWMPCAILDARMRGSWPILAELSTPTANLPVLYELNVDSEWLQRPRRLARQRRRIVAQHLAQHP